MNTKRIIQLYHEGYTVYRISIMTGYSRNRIDDVLVEAGFKKACVYPHSKRPDTIEEQIERIKVFVPTMDAETLERAQRTIKSLESGKPFEYIASK